MAQAFEDADVDVCEDYGEYYGCEWGFSRDAVRKIVAELPAADVVEVRRGRWIFDHMTGEWSYYSHCSECNHQEFFANETTEKRHKYGLNCGARMDKEADT